MSITAGGDTREYTWRIEAGEREKLTVPLLDGGEPIDITGWSVKAVIKDRRGGALLYTFPAEHVNINGSEVELTIPAPVSANWVWTVGWWHMEVTPPDPNPLDPPTQIVVAGSFLVDKH